jgi:hypothetical protein
MKAPFSGSYVTAHLDLSSLLLCCILFQFCLFLCGVAEVSGNLWPVNKNKNMNNEIMNFSKFETHLLPLSQPKSCSSALQ